MILEQLEDRFSPAILTVMNNQDFAAGGGAFAGSLRATIGAAQNNDVIVFAPALRNQTIRLTGGAIPITKNLTIAGIGSGINIDGNGTQIFAINTQFSIVSISGVTFWNGRAVAGGAIVSIGVLNLDGDTFNQNSAFTGGAVAISGPASSLVAGTCTFNTNTATATGGAIAADGANVVLNGCLFENNSAGLSGGAINAFNSSAAGLSLQVINCRFDQNRETATVPLFTTGGGGAIFTNYQLNVRYSQFTYNQAVPLGGAIYCLPDSGNNFAINFDSFLDNTASIGGAVLIKISLSQGSVTGNVSGSLFQDNNALGGASQLGGALDLDVTTNGTSSMAFTAANSTFFHNGSANNGGGVALKTVNNGTGTNTATLTSLTLTQNTANNNGGGLWIDPASISPRVGNNIIGANFACGNGPDVSGAVNSQNFNLIGVQNGSNGWNNDFLNTAPDLANAPAWNGGYTYTIALNAGSPAIQNGDPNLRGPNTDQRGFLRPQAAVTIGAFDPNATDPLAALAPPALRVNILAGVFNGNTYSATATVAGVIRGVDDSSQSTLENTAPTLSYYSGISPGSPLSAAPSQAGLYTVVASFPGSAHYSSASVSAIYVIAQAQPAISLIDAGGFFTGSPYPATATIAGVVVGVDNTPAAMLEGVGLVVTYYVGLGQSGNPLPGPPSDPGMYTVVAYFAGSSDYVSSIVSVSFYIMPHP